MNKNLLHVSVAIFGKLYVKSYLNVITVYGNKQIKKNIIFLSLTGPAGDYNGAHTAIIRRVFVYKSQWYSGKIYAPSRPRSQAIYFLGYRVAHLE